MREVWKRNYGQGTRAPPDERGGNRQTGHNVTAPHLYSTVEGNDMRYLTHLLIAVSIATLAAHLPAPAAQPGTADAPLPSSTASQGTPTLGTVERPMVVRVLPPEIAESEHLSQERERAEKWQLDSRLVTYTAVLAVFTAILAISTIALWWVTTGLRDFAAEQANDMKASIAVAKSSAEAAQMAAHSAVAAELPILIVEGVACGPGAAQATVRVGNHGRTPAIVTADCLVLTVRPALSDKPRYPIQTLDHPDRPRIVEPKREYSLQRSSTISEEEWKGVLARNEILWLYGYVEYTDYLKARRRDGFCFAFDPRPTVMYPTMPPADGAWVDAGPSTYTYTLLQST